MKDISSQAVVQYDVAHPSMAADDEEEGSVDFSKNKNVITMDDLLGGEDEPNQETNDIDEESQELYRQQFMSALKRQEIMQKGKEKVILGLEDDDDKFIIGLQGAAADPDDEGYVDAQKRREQKKDLKKVDHTQQNYIPINKSLYIETKEISRMTDKEVAEYRKSYGDIKVRGLKCPKPVQNWYQCGLPDSVIEVIERKNFTKPFPIQCQSIPAIMSGRDVIGIAETGSGKTLAYILPLIRHIRDQPPVAENEGMIGLVMAPTRELAF